MNFRSRELLDLCYQHQCMLQIPSVCEGGTGEPCHANWSEYGKGLGIKAHDVYAVPGCRKCHMELDQGKNLTGEQRHDIWLKAFLRYLPLLFLAGAVGPVGIKTDADALRVMLNRMYGGRPKSRKRSTETPVKCVIGTT